MSTAQGHENTGKTSPPNTDHWLWCLAIPAIVLGSLAVAKFVQANSIDASLYCAATWAAQEAAAPGASRSSVVNAARRSLFRDGCAGVCSNLDLRINGCPAMSHWIDCRGGDTISVTLTADPPLLVTELSHWFGIGLQPRPITVTAVVKHVVKQP